MGALTYILEEHNLLKKAIETTKQIQKIEDNETYHKALNDIILFFRNFSETYHHPKEENILFPLLMKHSKDVNAEFIHEITDNHEDFKCLMAEIENAFVIYDYKLLRALVNQYITYMDEHIKMENRMIMNLVPKILDEKELETAFTEFVKLDNKFGDKARLIEIFYKMNLQFA